MGEPSATRVRLLARLKTYLIMSLGFVVVALAILAWALLNGAPGYEEPDHGYTAVCKDGAVLEPPWNSCEHHGGLDHWAD